MQQLSFVAPMQTISERPIVRIPLSISKQLPSRGQVMVEGTISGQAFTLPLEPDGEGSHWLDCSTFDAATIQDAKQNTITISPINEWPEPSVPSDLQSALRESAAAEQLWKQITALARWEWIRWIAATNNPQTRQRRIAVACSKLENGSRRPCCFNRNMCCVPDVSKNGVLRPADS